MLLESIKNGISVVNYASSVDLGSLEQKMNYIVIAL